ncbi:MAG: MotA/TolQ/ExbB proton channel family protein [Acidobacteria bacterium]|nr:MotA/TolQ/ExbB proton channel family protein [Acidobacteriota bacterium]
MISYLLAMNVAELIKHSGYVAKGVLIILLIFSLISWSVILDRFLNYKRYLKRATDYYDKFRNAKNVGEIVNFSRNFPDNPFKEMFLETYREFHEQITENPQTNPNPTIKSTENLERTLQRVMRGQTLHLESGLAFLATTASAAPFIGLFGTVWGIMEAFRAIGQTGSATLASVAPGISEALIATAAGLFAAIPALIGYNLLGRKIKAFNAYMEQFGLDIINLFVKKFT